jgi:hypothetical protein
VGYDFMEVFYKFQNWWGHLGLTLLGIAYLRIFDLSIFVYLGIAYCMLLFSHLWDDKQPIAVKVAVGTFLLFFLFLYAPAFWAMILAGIMCLGYDSAKKTPLSALYKGFGYSLLFWLPFKEFDLNAVPIFFLISGIAIVSEITHEAEHYECDKSEGRYTTAHALGIKMSHEDRVKLKIFIMLLGLALLVILSIRN